MLSEQAPDTAVTVVVESETVVETPESQAVAEKAAEAEAPAEAPKIFVAPTPIDKTQETDETARPARVMEGGGPITSTTTAFPMTAEEAPIKGMPAEAAPETEAEGNVLPGGTPPGLPDVPLLGQQGTQDTVTAPGVEEQSQGPPAETPLAMVPPPATQADEPLREPKTAESPEQEILPGWPALLARAGWRVAEVGLGLLLVGLIVAVVWVRRRK